MSAYGRKKKRASVKRKRATSRGREPEAKKRRKRKVLSAKPKAKRKVPAKTRTKKKAQSSRTRTRAKAKKPLRKPAPRKKAPRKAAVAKRPTRAPKKTAKTKTLRASAKKRTTKLSLRRQITALQAKLDRLEEKRQKARRKTARKPKRQVKAEYRRGKRQVEESRRKTKLVTEDLPRATPKERKSSEEAIRQRQRKNFRRLLTIAKNTDQLPKPKNPGLRRVDNEKAVGEQRFVRVGKILEPQHLPEILYKVDHAARGMSGAYANWMAVMVFSTLGDRLVGYGQRILKADDPDAPDFSAEVVDSTGANDSIERMMTNLEFKLEDLAGELSTVVYLHFVKVMNFTRRVER